MADDAPKSTWELVNGQFVEANNYAEEAWNMAEPFIDELRSVIAINDLDTSAVDFDFEPVPAELIAVTRPSTKEIANPTGEAPVFPDGLFRQPDSIPDDFTVPPNTIKPVEIVYPSKPNGLLTPTDPGEPADPKEVTIPNAPTLTFPNEPNINTAYLMPDKPNISIPSFTAVAPVDNLVAPSNTFNYIEEAYQSDLLDAVKAKLAADLAAGGTGLGATAEAAIWNRALDRQAELDEKLFNETLEFWASRGWNLPVGAMSAKLAEAHNESRRSTEKLNYDIAQEQARLAYQNVKDTIQAIITLEQSLIQHSDTVANRGLDAAKATIDAAVNVFNAQVSRLQIAWEGYKAAATVYEVMTRTQSLLVELYTAQLNAVKLESDIELSKLEVYKGQLSAIGMRIEIYKGELQGAGMALDAEKTKLAIFQMRIEIFTAAINANTAKYNQYQAEMQGEQIKAQVYAEQLKGYLAELEAAKLKLEVYVKEAEMDGLYNEQLVKKYSAEIAGYEAELKGQVAYIENAAKIYSADASMYEADARKAAADAESNIKANAANLEALQGKLQLELKQAEINISNANNMNQLRIEAAKAGANVTAQMAAGALASINTTAGLQSSDTNSWDNTRDVHTYSHNMTSECNEC